MTMHSRADLENRLRRDADLVRRAAPPGPTLHHRIMVRLATTEAAPPMPWARRLATQGLLTVAMVALAVVGVFLLTRHLAPSPAKEGPPPAKYGALYHNGQIVLSSVHALIANDPATGQFHQLFAVPTDVIVSGAAYSRDGRKLAYLTGPGSATSSISVLDTVTGRTQQLTTCGCGAFSHLSWSPDGSRLAYSSSGQFGGGQVYVIDADGTHKTQLTDYKHVPLSGSEPSWSPDGTRIAFITDSSTGSVAVSNVDVIRPDGTGLTVLLHGVTRIFAIAWSPDGSRIAYVDDSLSSTPGLGASLDYELWLMNADGSHRTKVFTKPGCCMTLFGGPAWSPDGTQIAVVAGALWVMNADGSDPRNLGATIPPGGDTPTWQPVP